MSADQEHVEGSDVEAELRVERTSAKVQVVKIALWRIQDEYGNSGPIADKARATLLDAERDATNAYDFAFEETNLSSNAIQDAMNRGMLYLPTLEDVEAELLRIGWSHPVRLAEAERKMKEAEGNLFTAEHRYGIAKCQLDAARRKGFHVTVDHLKLLTEAAFMTGPFGIKLDDNYPFGSQPPEFVGVDIDRILGRDPNGYNDPKAIMEEFGYAIMVMIGARSFVPGLYRVNDVGIWEMVDGITDKANSNTPEGSRHE